MMAGVDNAERAGRFLALYSSGLLSSGATTLRTERNMLRMADSFGIDVQLTILPMHCEVSVRKDKGNGRLLFSEQYSRGINFNAITAMSRMSWKVADGRLTVEQAERLLSFVKAQSRYPDWIVAFAAGVANASFCRLFCGDLWAMAFVFLCTVMGFWLKRCLIHRSVDLRIAVILAGMVSAITASGCYIFSLGATPDVAVAASVLYLVPGIPFINAFSNFMHGHYVCAAAIFMHAIETTACLGIGLFCGIMILNNL